MAERKSRLAVDVLHFADDGRIPNNPTLPLLLYHGALLPDWLAPEACEARFLANRWSGGWRDGIFATHHYHSTAHEVLGIVRGKATVTFGGPKGRTVELLGGDVAVVPAGTGHKREAGSPDLLVIGAYPDGMAYDTIYADPDAHDAAIQAIARVPLPACDPLFGVDGPLARHWFR